MSNVFRKIRRNALKKHLGTNKIKDFWHQMNDPLYKRLNDGIKNAQKTNRK